MRHVQITHIYVLPVPEDEVEALDPIVNSGVSIMENMMKSSARNIRELRTDWQLMPKEYSRTVEVEGTDDISFTHGRPVRRYADDSGMSETEIQRDSILSKQIIEADTDRGINFVGDVMGQKPGAMHPWMQGLSIFPEDHPLRPYEDNLRAVNDKEALEHLQALSPKMKELPPGNG